MASGWQVPGFPIHLRPYKEKRSHSKRNFGLKKENKILNSPKMQINTVQRFVTQPGRPTLGRGPCLLCCVPSRAPPTDSSSATSAAVTCCAFLVCHLPPSPLFSFFFYFSSLVSTSFLPFSLLTPFCSPFLSLLTLLCQAVSRGK